MSPAVRKSNLIVDLTRLVRECIRLRQRFPGREPTEMLTSHQISQMEVVLAKFAAIVSR